jgi:nucleoid DNA-binding protein
MKNDKIIKEFVVRIFPTLDKMTKAELIDAIASGSKLTKADAGRMLNMSRKELLKFFTGMSEAQLIDAIAASAKLTKADAGRALDDAIELIHARLKTVFGGKGQ